MSSTLKHLQEASQKLDAFINDSSNIQAIDNAIRLIKNTYHSGGKVISCGNGGSMCDAMHLAEELTGKFRDERSPFSAIAISDPSYLSCAGNDFGYEAVFSRFIEGVGIKGDVLVAITTSGNSPNVIRAMKAARDKGMHVIALTGKDGGTAADLADVEIRAPYAEYADRAQEIHIKVIHCIIAGLEE